MNKKPNPIFIVGLPRSGSTLWHNIIVLNPSFMRLAEIHYLSPWRRDFRYFLKKKVGELADDDNIKKMLELIFSDKVIPGITGAFWRFENIRAYNEPKLKKDIFKNIVDSDRSLGSIFKILIEKIVQYNKYNSFCIKFPVYVNYIPQLIEWYPECKILHITRDPRAIAISKTNDPGGTRLIIAKYPYLKFFIRKIMILFVIVQYVWTSKLHCKFKQFHNYTLFRYEDLLADPEKTIQELCDFIEIDYMPGIIDPEKGKHDHQPSSVTGEKRKSFDKRAARHWKNAISPLEDLIITTLTQKSMQRFEYNPKTHPVYSDD